MAEECPSGKYAAELVTASGLSIAHPTEDPGSTLGAPHSLIDWSGSEGDFAEWHALAEALMGRLERAWVLYKTWPGTQHVDVGTYNAFVEKLNDARTRYAAIRLPWRSAGSAADKGWTWYVGPDFAWDATDDIAKTTQLLIDVQCLRQRLDDALAAMGGSPERPGAGHKPTPEGLSLLGTIALGVGATALIVGTYSIARKVMK